MKRCIVWLRKDLRIQDHAAFAAAIENGYEIVALYLLAEDEESEWGMGGASKWWLHHALVDLGEELEGVGGTLHVRIADEGSELALLGLVDELGAEVVYWTRCYEPLVIERDKGIKSRLKELGVEVRSFAGNVLHEPHEVETKAGGPYQVFTPYWKMARSKDLRISVRMKWTGASFFKGNVVGSSVDALGLLPAIDWDGGMVEFWNPTRSGGEYRLSKMRDGGAERYNDVRDFPDEDGTSLLSPYLHWGQLSVLEVHGCLKRLNSGVVDDGLVRQLYWRDFAHHLIYHFPKTPTKTLRDEWELFPWKLDEEVVGAWERGETGYPIVDAAMKQLWKTGWMHNRCRMIVASLLVKHLQQDWLAGAQWFWDTLVDADLANNTLGWQWTAGCGADAAPYFRVFNPITQGKRFDRSGDYVREFLPALKNLPTKYIHEPWEAPEEVLANADVRLGDNYPKVVVAHDVGRKRALDAYAAFKEAKDNR